MFKYCLVLFIVLFGVGCGEICRPLTQRCNGTKVQMCDAHGKKWHTIMDCSKLKHELLKFKCTVIDLNKCTCKSEVPQ